MGAGLSGQVALKQTAAASSPDAGSASSAAATSARVANLETLAVATSIAPWVGGRIGLQGDNEAGLTYTGRTIRIDGRHAFNLGAPTLSVGLGASAITAERPGQSSDVGSVFGGGLDVPVLIGVNSKNDLYALWFGPRGGFETMRGVSALPSAASASSGTVAASEEVSAQHYYVGFVAGIRAGFRHVHVALELDGAFHYATGKLGDTDVSLNQLTLTPSGALIVSF